MLVITRFPSWFPGFPDVPMECNAYLGNRETLSGYDSQFAMENHHGY